MPYPDPRPLRLLVIRYRFIGDTVLAIPFLRNLRHAFPHAQIDVLAEPVSGDTLRHCPYKNTLLYYAPRAKRGGASPHPRSLWSCARMLRARRYDRAYILRRSFSSAILPWLAGIPHRVGFATEGRNWLLQRSTPYADRHEVECFLDVLRADGVPVLDARNENWSDPDSDARVTAEMARRTARLPTPAGAARRRRVFVCAKSVYRPKDWTPDRFADVVGWLIRSHGCEIHFCDAPANASYYRGIVDALPAELRPYCLDWSRELRIAEVNSLFRSIDLALGIDTGLLHIAASFHIPVVALFGPLEPWRWHPWDTAHTVVRPDDVSGEQPLLAITTERVKSALASYLDAPLTASPVPP